MQTNQAYFMDMERSHSEGIVEAERSAVEVHQTESGPVACKVRECFSQCSGEVGGKVTAGALRRLIHAQNYRCALSGDELTPDNAQLDHITAATNGGSNGIGNVIWVSELVNQAKGTMDVDEFVSMCCAVADHCRGSYGCACLGS